MLKKISLGDGRVVAVDAARFAAFDALRPQLERAFAADGRLMARDAGEALAFLISQLAYTEAQAYAKLYTPMQFREFIPVSGEGGWKDEIRYELLDFAGQGKRISGAGRDLPRVDVQFGAKSFPVVPGGIAYGYLQEELMKSAYFRTPLPSARLEAAMLGAERHLNDVALNGEQNLTGFFNNANVPQGNAPTGTWGSATPDNILKDINTGISTVWSNTAYNDHVTDIAMAPSAYAYIASTPRSSTSDTTILKYLLENNIAKLERGIDLRIRPCYGLNTAGSGGTRRAIYYVRKESRLKMHIPVELQFLAPQYVGLEVEIPGTYRYSGVEWRYPKSALYQDDI